MSFVYTAGAVALAAGSAAWATAAIGALLVMSNTTADTERDVSTVAGFSTLDEFVGGDYARQSVPGRAVNPDTAGDRAELDATVITFGSAVPPGVRQVVGMVVYVGFGGADSAAVPLFFLDSGFPITPGGAALTVTPAATGVARLGSA